MATVAQNLQSILDTKAAIKGAIKNVTGETQSDVFATYPEKIEGMADVSDSMTFGHTVNGKWVKPNDWDDIESMELDDEHDTIYLLYKLTGEPLKFAYLLIGHTSSTSLTVSYGHVSNGIYTIHQSCTEQTLTGGTSHYVGYDFSNLQDEYVVIKIQSSANRITRVSTTNTPANQFPNINSGVLYAQSNPCVMRYGNMPRGSNLMFRTYIFESDNIIDFAKNIWDTETTVTVSEAYSGNLSMQRWRHTGWDLSRNKITTFASMFYNCAMLCDIDRDLSSWVTSNATTVSSMFYYCTKLRYLDVSDWDLTNITTLSSLFVFCVSLTKVIGIDTWTGGSKCTSVSSMFYYTWSLRQDIDLSGLDIGQDTSSISLSGFIAYSGITSMNISGWDLSKTSTGISLTNCYHLKHFITTNTILPKYGNCNQIFYLARSLEELRLVGFDCKTNATEASTFYQYMAYWTQSLKRCEFIDSLFPDNISISDTSAQYGYLFYACVNLEYLDVRDMDFSVFTGTMAHLYAFRNCYRLVDFYPPKNLSKNLNITGDYSLSHESLQRIITNLVDLTEQTSQKITMGAYNVAKLTQTDIDNITAKNWTYGA